MSDTETYVDTVSGELLKIYCPHSVTVYKSSEWFPGCAGDRFNHRIDGPAKIWPDGGYEYWNYGKIHKSDGPAGVYPNHSLYYAINGNEIHLSIIASWIKECDINPNWQEWTDSEKVLFRMRFA